MIENNSLNNSIVSVIIPVYQAEKYLMRCVNSVIKQTYKKLEIILIDDGSNDNSLSICYKLAKEDDRIVVLHQANAGVAVTRNRGLVCANGEFIYFLDSDDWIEQDTILSLVEALKKQDSDICICGFKQWDNQKVKEFSFEVDVQVNFQDFLQNYFWKLYEETVLFNIGTKLYKKQIIETNHIRFCENMVIYEDICFFLEYLKAVEKIELFGNPYYYYYIGNNTSSTHLYKKEFWKSTVDYCIALKEGCNDNYPHELVKALSTCLYRAYLQECHNPDLTRKYFCQTLENYCFPLINYLNITQKSVLKISMEQKIFMKLAVHKCSLLLWLLALVVSVRN